MSFPGRDGELVGLLSSASLSSFAASLFHFLHLLSSLLNFNSKDSQTSADAQISGTATGAMSHAFVASLTK